MHKTYKAKKGSFIKRLFILFVILPVAIFFLDQTKYIARPYLILPFITPFFLILWAYFDTFYRIDDKQLYYRFSFIRGRINVEDISEILDGARLRKGKKPALSDEGFVIKYLNKDEKRIFLAPENKDELIKDLLKINQGIVLK